MTRTITLTRSKLAVIAIVPVAIILTVAVINNYSARVAEAEAVESITKDAGQVTAGQLARWILDRRQDYQLIDLRDPWQFDDYHIPGAFNIPFDQFFAGGNLQRLDKNKKIVVYGLGAGHSAQTQLLLAMKGYRALALTDGIVAWWDEIMTPTSLRSATPSSSGYQQARQLREHFLKGAQPDGAQATAAAPLPPAPPSATSSSGPKSASPVPKPAASAAKPVKPQPKPVKKPAENAPPQDKEKERLKLGAGCS